MRQKAYSTTSTSRNGRPSSPKLVRTSTPGIYKKASGYAVTFYDRTGKQRKRSAPTLTEARKLKALLTAEAVRGDVLADVRLTFADYAVTWIASYDGRTARGIRPGTLNAYREALGLDQEGQLTGRGAIAYFGRMRLASVRVREIKDYARYLASQGLARNTI